jgi:hypothetical protein
VGSDTPLVARAVDGWHRIFAARLFHVPHLRCRVDYEDPRPAAVYGCLEEFSFNGERLVARGWCVTPQRVPESVEVRADGRTLARVGISFRNDVKSLLPTIPHAYRSGFVVDAPCNLPPDEPQVFRFIPLSDWLPAGAMTVLHLPELRQARNWPPPALARRLLEEDQPTGLAFSSASALHQLLEPLLPHRPLDTFQSVLGWGTTCALLQFDQPPYLPAAPELSLQVDPEMIEWCHASDRSGGFQATPPLPPTDLPGETFDLVLGFGTLGGLDRQARCAWLEELHRVLRPGGYVSLATHGEPLGSPIDDGSPAATPLTRPYTAAAFAPWFELVEHVEGGAVGDADLVVLRKPIEGGWLAERLRSAARSAIPADATVLVASKGDEDLLDLGDRPGWHFPRGEQGWYAGHHPADSEQAIHHLDSLRAAGAQFFIIPSTAFWWLSWYAAFRDHLETAYRRAYQDSDCIVYDLR